MVFAVIYPMGGARTLELHSFIAWRNRLKMRVFSQNLQMLMETKHRTSGRRYDSNNVKMNSQNVQTVGHFGNRGSGEQPAQRQRSSLGVV
jgi:hypothetical protein